MLLRYYLFRFLQLLEKGLAKFLPRGRVRNTVLSCYYRLTYTLPLGTETFTYFDGTVARFYRFLSMSQAVPDNGDEVRAYLAKYDLKEGDCVVDCGAWPGDFAIYAAKKVGDSGRVICFEPNPFNRRILGKNIGLNHLDNIEIVDKGVGAKDGSFRMFVAGKHSGITDYAYKSAPLEVDIRVTTIDEEMNRRNVQRVDLVKMDIEGAEIEAVRGCRRIMEESPVHFTISSHHPTPDGKKTCHALESLFSSMGYASETANSRITFAHPANANGNKAR